jgi:hypothetical protein
LIASLLTPTRLYASLVQGLLAEGAPIRGMDHITGGGLPENLPRCLPAGVHARVDPGSWERPPLFRWLQEQGGRSQERWAQARTAEGHSWCTYAGCARHDVYGVAPALKGFGGRGAVWDVALGVAVGVAVLGVLVGGIPSFSGSARGFTSLCGMPISPYW